MSELTKRVYTSIILLTLFFLALYNFYFFTILLILINFQILNEFFCIFKKIFKKNKLKLFLSIIIILLYLSLFSTVIWFYLFENFESSTYLIIFLVLICAATDIGGYFFGKMIGGKKITKISPKKTYSGLFGAFILSLLIGILFYNKFNDLILININSIFFIITISFFSQFGDLIISFLKRKADIKDTGSILPGHGGILDRIDGILLAIPLSVIIIYMF